MRLLIHGGAGPIPREEVEAGDKFHAALAEAVHCGHAVLARGGSALDAVTESVVWLEECPLFNAGRGSVLNHEGRVEMDAAVMCGATLEAGAIANVSRIRNPVRAARAVLSGSPHVLLCGAGAEVFAEEHQCEMVDPAWFVTPERVARWEALRATQTVELDHAGLRAQAGAEGKFGTVGAVALDQHGNLAAATSTGGITNKRWGRIGDSPLLGAGTYADNRSVAVSFTGIGEYMMRMVAAHSLAAHVEIGGLSLSEASARVLARLEALGGSAGFIAIDHRGDFTLSMNTEGMLRGWVGDDGRIETAIFA